MRKLSLLAMGCCIMFGGCIIRSEIPVGRNHDVSFQRTMVSAAHWDLFAQDVAAALAPTLDKDQPAHIRSDGGNSTFSAVFSDLLASRIIGQGVAVVPTGYTGQTISYRVHSIHHGAGRPDPRHLPHSVLGTVAGMTVWIIDEGLSIGSGLLPFAGAAIGGALDILDNETAASTDAELVISVALSKNGFDVSRITRVYYVFPDNLDEYETKQPRRSIPVVRD